SSRTPARDPEIVLVCREAGGIIFYDQANPPQQDARSIMDVSEENYRLLFENNPQPMYIYDLESLRFLAVNEAALRQYGYSRDEFLTMTIEQIRPADELSRLKEYLRYVPEGYHMAGTWQHRRKDGTAIAVEVTASTGMFGGRRAR